MNRNREFGRRVRQAREDAGLSRKLLARLASIDLARVELIEASQIDESDLGHQELTRLADVLNKPLTFLANGDTYSPASTEAGIIAQRSLQQASQLPLDLYGTLCPHCLQPGHGGRCNNCGRSTD